MDWIGIAANRLRTLNATRTQVANKTWRFVVLLASQSACNRWLLSAEDSEATVSSYPMPPMNSRWPPNYRSIDGRLYKHLARLQDMDLDSISVWEQWRSWPIQSHKHPRVCSVLDSSSSLAVHEPHSKCRNQIESPFASYVALVAVSAFGMAETERKLSDRTPNWTLMTYLWSVEHAPIARFWFGLGYLVGMWIYRVLRWNSQQQNLLLLFHNSGLSIGSTLIRPISNPIQNRWTVIECRLIFQRIGMSDGTPFVVVFNTWIE